MANDAKWLVDFDARTQECIDAKAAVALEASPRVWPLSGSATEFNPDGHPLSRPSGVEPFDSKVKDERTPNL